MKRSNREWVQSVLSHHDGEPVPFNLSLSPVSRARLEQHFGVSDVEAAVACPIRMTGMKSIKPLYASPKEFGAQAKDEYGVVWSTNEIDRGHPIIPCLKEPTIKGYTFPDPKLKYRYEGLPEWCKKHKDNYRIAWLGDLWERATFMRGMDGILLDVALHPAFVEELLDGICEYNLRSLEILSGAAEVECVAVSDDYGTQKSLIMSPASWRRLVKPRLAKIYERIKSKGYKVFHHSCGNIYPIIKEMMDIGLDILHPIQPEAMDVNKLKREFGKSLSFFGGLRTQDLLPRGTPSEVRSEVRRLKRELGAGGGYVLEPGITLQADVPLENMLAMIEEAKAE